MEKEGLEEQSVLALLPSLLTHEHQRKKSHKKKPISVDEKRRTRVFPWAAQKRRNLFFQAMLNSDTDRSVAIMGYSDGNLHNQVL